MKFESEIGVSELEIWDREFSRDLPRSKLWLDDDTSVYRAKNMKTRIAQAAAPVRYSAAVEQVYNTKITCCEEVLPPCVYLETNNTITKNIDRLFTARFFLSSIPNGTNGRGILAVVGKINASSVEDGGSQGTAFFPPSPILFSVPSTRETNETVSISRPGIRFLRDNLIDNNGRGRSSDDGDRPSHSVESFGNLFGFLDSLSFSVLPFSPSARRNAFLAAQTKRDTLGSASFPMKAGDFCV